MDAWDPSQVACWLRCIGLAQHAETFVDNAVNGLALIELDDDALGELDVSGPELALFHKKVSVFP